MSEPDFNPQMTTVELEQWTGQKAPQLIRFPAVGSTVAMVYIEASGSNRAAILAKLDEIDALSDDFVKRTRTPSAEPGKKASVDVRVTVRTEHPL